MRASIPIVGRDHRTECLSADQFRYEAQGDICHCPADKELRVPVGIGLTSRSAITAHVIRECTTNEDAASAAVLMKPV